MKEQTSVAAEAAHLPKLTAFLQQFWSSASLPPGECLAFELALEEIFMNVVMHGAAAGEERRQVQVSLALSPEGLTMTVEDDGPQFVRPLGTRAIAHRAPATLILGLHCGAAGWRLPCSCSSGTRLMEF